MFSTPTNNSLLSPPLRSSLGVVLDTSCINNVTRSSYFHLYNTDRLCPSLSSHCHPCPQLHSRFIMEIPFFLTSSIHPFRSYRWFRPPPVNTSLPSCSSFISSRFCTIFKILLYTFKAIYYLASPYLSDLLHTFNPAHLTTMGGQGIQLLCSQLWNSLLSEPWNVASLPLIKSAEKTWFDQSLS